MGGVIGRERNDTTVANMYNYTTTVPTTNVRCCESMMHCILNTSFLQSPVSIRALPPVTCIYPINLWFCTESHYRVFTITPLAAPHEIDAIEKGASSNI
jgi:hypothetical protein